MCPVCLSAIASEPFELAAVVNADNSSVGGFRGHCLPGYPYTSIEPANGAETASRALSYNRAVATYLGHDLLLFEARPVIRGPRQVKPAIAIR